MVERDPLEDFPDYIIKEIIEDARSELTRTGIWFSEVEDLDTYGVRFRSIAFRDVSVNLENPELRKSLSEASSSWERLFRALALERLFSDDAPQISDYVYVEEISWNKCYGPCVRLDVSLDVDELLQNYGFAGDINVREMEEALEGILDYEARKILRRLNKALTEFLQAGKG